MNLNTNINLDKPKSESKTMLLHSITYGKTRFRIKTGQKILPKNWNANEQKVRSSGPNASSINAIIKKQKGEIESVCNRLIFEEKPITKVDVVNHVKFTKKVAKVEFSFLNLYAEWMAISKLRISPNTLKGYKTTYNHLKSFNEAYKFNISFEVINDTFLHFFSKYILTDLGSFNNTLWKNVKNLKAFLKWAHDKGYSHNIYYTKFHIQQENDKDIIALTYEQVKTIEALDLNERLSKIRDLFLIEWAISSHIGRGGMLCQSA